MQEQCLDELQRMAVLHPRNIRGTFFHWVAKSSYSQPGDIGNQGIHPHDNKQSIFVNKLPEVHLYTRYKVDRVLSSPVKV